ncbi:MAG: S49 family peptidase [Candidatus Cloacimonetes bacterium]|nr:S49 family peptidase [Candidatus Cloacimonadota bacterium]
MKRFLLWMFSLLALLLLMIFVMGLVAVRQFKGGTQAAVGGNSLLVLRWDGTLPGHGVPLMERSTGRQLSLSTLIPAIERAAEDDRIKAIVVEGDASMSREHLFELAQALEHFRASGKPIHAHLAMASDAQYQLACLADRLSLSDASSSGLIFIGTAIHQTYRRELMDRLGVRMRVRHVGEAKGFGENWVLDSMSVAVRENMSLLVEDRQHLYAQWVGSARDINPEEFRALSEAPDRFLLTPSEALEAGLVDVLESHRQWEDYLKEQFGAYQLLEVGEWVASQPEPAVGDHVAVVWAEGEILPGRSNDTGAVRIHGETLARDLGRLAEDSQVKAVVLRVESPGGAVQPSEEVYLELQRLAGMKPLVVSMGSMAASGGYYISLPGAMIMASPWTVTGSIGVVAMLPDLEGSFKKLGLNEDGVFSTPLSRLVIGEPVPQGLLDAMGRSMEEIYRVFTGRVLQHRPLSPEDLPAWAGGRVWSGLRANSAGLVDSLGTLADAISAASGLAGGVDGIRHYPLQEDLLELLFSGRLRPRDLFPMLGQTQLPAEVLDLLAPLKSDPRSMIRSEWEWELLE